MVIVRLTGGLANQMFPYAAGRRLAHVLGTELKLDISGFADYGQQDQIDFRHYALDVFNIEASIATDEEVRALVWRESNFLEKLFCRKPKQPATYVRERQYHFDPRILGLKGSVYLCGNWNSPKYFEDVVPLIRREFTFRQPVTGLNREMLNAIEAVNAVSVHVRRGDYVSNPKTASIHGTCDLGYYRACFDLLAQKLNNPHYFLFSDDPEWVGKHLNLTWPSTIVEHNGPLDGHEDLRLMSRCRHHIIANSGFSWWAAWLNPSPNKIVLSPKRWFNTTKYDTGTLIPEGWLRL